MKVVVFVAVIAFFVSCKNVENKKDIELLKIENNDTLNRNQITIENITYKKEIIDNEFANMPLGEFDFIDKDLSQFFTQSYEEFITFKVNKYTNDIDTLITFKKGNSVVRFTKTTDKILLDSLNVSENNFVKFKPKLEIGMYKNEVLKLFEVNPKYSFSDSISIIDDEGSASVQFYFKENKLKKILVLPW